MLHFNLHSMSASRKHLWCNYVIMHCSMCGFLFCSRFWNLTMPSCLGRLKLLRGSLWPCIQAQGDQSCHTFGYYFKPGGTFGPFWWKVSFYVLRTYCSHIFLTILELLLHRLGFLLAFWGSGCHFARKPWQGLVFYGFDVWSYWHLLSRPWPLPSWTEFWVASGWGMAEQDGIGLCAFGSLILFPCNMFTFFLSQ